MINTRIADIIRDNKKIINEKEFKILVLIDFVYCYVSFFLVKFVYICLCYPLDFWAKHVFILSYNPRQNSTCDNNS